MKGRYTWKSMLMELVMILLAVLAVFPVALVIMNSVKSNQQILSSILSVPTEFHWENFANALEKMNFWPTLRNSLVTTIFSVAGIVLFGSMAAYQLARKKNVATELIFFVLVLAMTIPFQALMIPLVIIAGHLGLTNSLPGLILIYIGFSLPLAIFLYRGAIQSIPRELEEAAMIDGCGPIRCFFLIVFPLIRPMTATIVILDALAVFNDFSLPMILISAREMRTIPLAISSFFGTYLSDWNLIMAALTISIVPVLVFFLTFQKNIMSGLAEGALKG